MHIYIDGEFSVIQEVGTNLYISMESIIVFLDLSYKINVILLGISVHQASVAQFASYLLTFFENLSFSVLRHIEYFSFKRTYEQLEGHDFHNSFPEIICSFIGRY